MKHVVIAAPYRQAFLVTGFGAFHGARRNPTAEILERLERHRGPFARLGIDLRCLLLPVVYSAVGPALEAAALAYRPAAILHLGLAGRRRRISLETRAVNRASPLHLDAAKTLHQQVIAPGAPTVLRATYPARRLEAVLRRAGHDARLSIDAGDYVCNATLYYALHRQLAPTVGFVHVPHVRQRMRPPERRPTVGRLTEAVVTLLMDLARHARGEDAMRFLR